MSRNALTILGSLAILAGLFAIVSAPTNTPLEGWAMLVRALAGQGLVIAGVDCLARASLRRPSRTARLVALLGSSVVLFPLAVIVLLMSKEGGSSWGVAALLLMAWYAISAIYAVVALLRVRRAAR